MEINPQIDDSHFTKPSIQDAPSAPALPARPAPASPPPSN
jgi:hypothetical protein